MKNVGRGGELRLARPPRPRPRSPKAQKSGLSDTR